MEIRRKIVTFAAVNALVSLILMFAIGYFNISFAHIWIFYVLIGLSALTILLVLGLEKIDFNSNVLEILKKHEVYVKRDLYKIVAKPGIEGNLSFLDEVYGGDEGRVFVQFYLDLEPTISYKKEEVFEAIKRLIAKDFWDEWHNDDTDIISEKVVSVKHLKRHTKEMSRYIVTVEIPQNVRPPVRPPYNGYKHLFVRTIQEVVPVTRI